MDYSGRKNVHRIEVRTSDGETILSTHLVPHSVERLYPFDRESILIMGKAFTSEGWVTYYSIVRSCCGAMAVETHPIPTLYQVEEFAGTPENLFFNETGERSVVAKTGGTTKLLPIEVSGPGQMQLVGDHLWILERQSFYLGDENIVRLNLKTLRAERVFPQLRNGLVSILALADGSAIAATELRAQKVVFIDSQDPTRQTSIKLSGTHPRSLTQWGKCLLVGSEEPNRITVINLQEKKPSIVFEFDLEQYTFDLPRLNKITVDSDTGNIFLRSSVVQEAESDSRNSVYRFSNSQWLSECAAKK
ncbi:MAG: hypothetical protein EBQ92_12250 [Proteobacteria bacterium]|nr:hypothetical protein [Pseudomonadota bacterium]